MPTGPNGQKRPADLIGNTVHVARIAIGETEDSGLVQPAKRKVGLAGTSARVRNRTEEQRVEIARKVANVRWG